MCAIGIRVPPAKLELDARVPLCEPQKCPKSTLIHLVCEFLDVNVCASPDARFAKLEYVLVPHKPHVADRKRNDSARAQPARRMISLNHNNVKTLKN